MKVLLTGANGNLGGQIATVFRGAGHEVIATDRGELDITNNEDVRRKVREVQPDAIINAAAYNLVDKVEDPEVYPLAYAINALGPKHLAEAAREQGCVFLHYSTDYVFAGDKPEGYTEDDATAPISKYGETKALGEAFVHAAGGTSYVCRLSKIFGPKGTSDAAKPGFVDVMLRLAKEKPELKIVDEEVGMPTYTKDIAEQTLWMLTQHVAPGVYHIVNEGEGVTWYGFAEEFFALAGVTTPRTPVTSKEFPRAAKLPKFAMLRNTKLPKLRSRKEALQEFIANMYVCRDAET